MKIVVAIDSFKGSLSSIEAGSAAKEGIQLVDKNADVEIIPIADGGEGTVDALVLARKGEKRRIVAKDPLGRDIECEYGIIDGNLAVIEMSAAAGITLLKESELNPLYTTTYGVGQMIADAISLGCRKFIIGIGGSATNDCGIGMLQALGFGLLDKNGNQVGYGANGLKDIVKIDLSGINPVLPDCEFNIACDVKNPLCFENGCSAVYARQKGADDQMIADMDKWIFDYSELVKTVFANADINVEGAGAAGGLGYAFVSFLGGNLTRGIDLVLTRIDIDEKIKKCDLVITGEGRLDGQTVMGKAPIGVARIAKRYNKTCIAFAGGVTPDAVACNEAGIDAFFPIVRGITTLEQAMKKENAYNNMVSAVMQAYRLFKIKE